jgi:hypothetical protein
LPRRWRCPAWPRRRQFCINSRKRRTSYDGCR